MTAKTKNGQIPKKNLTNGMKQPANSKKSALSSAEVCSIIETCRQSGVAEISIGELHLKFGESVSPPNHSPPVSAEIPGGVLPDHEQINKDTLISEEMREREERIAMLILEDPQEFERQLTGGDLEELLVSEDEESVS